MYNGRKILIYIDNYDLTTIDSLNEGLAEVYPIIDVQRATWIKPRNSTSQAILIQFPGEEVPEYLRITGDSTSTRVYPYNEKPLKKLPKIRTWEKTVHGRATHLQFVRGTT